MRIVSFLPAATEMACALGLEEAIVGVSHECDYPAAMRDKPVVVHNALALAAMSPREIDTSVSAALRDGASLYAVDETLLRALAPDLILTQDLCQVCAPSGNQITRLIGSLDRRPDVLYFTPRTLADVDENLLALGDATGRRAKAEEIVAANRARLARIGARVARVAKRPRVFFAEWVDPVYCAGHWVPEMISLAGGEPVVARAGGESVRVTREEVVAARPEVVVVGPCGFSLAAAREQAVLLNIPARRVVVVDANAFFARPGARLIDGVEMLFEILHGSAAARVDSWIEL
jgi:iron complex transport system substrate-binding protein